MAEEFKKRHSRLLQILELSKSDKLPQPQPISQIEARPVVEALCHASFELRSRLVDEVCAGQTKAVQIAQLLIRMLGAKSLKVYQSRMAGLEALAMIASHNSLEDLRPDSKSALLKLIVEGIVSDKQDVADVCADVAFRFNLVIPVAKKLFSQVEEQAKMPGCTVPLAALAKLNFTDDMVILSVLKLLASEPNLMSPKVLPAVQNLFHTAVPECFTKRCMKRLIDICCETSEVRLQCFTLRTLAIRFGDKLLNHQIEAENAATQEGSRFEADEQHGRCLELIQDLLESNDQTVRAEAVAFLRLLNSSHVFPKVIAQQMSSWLKASEPSKRRMGLSNLVLWLMPSEPSLSIALYLLELNEPRSEALATVALDAQLARGTEFVELDHEGVVREALKDYVGNIIAELIIDAKRSPNVSLFTKAEESPPIRAAAFDLLRQSQTFSHTALNNASTAITVDHELLELAAVRYLACSAVLGSASLRSPAALLIKDFLEASVPSRAVNVLEAIHVLSGKQDFKEAPHLLDALAPHLLSTSSNIVSLTTKILVNQLDDASSSRRICSFLASRLLNVSSDEDRIGVVHSIQRLGCASNRMLVGMLTTLLDNDNTTMKLAVLEALASSDVHVTEAEEKASRLLHKSDQVLSDAAAFYLFRATPSTLKRHQPPLVNVVVNAAAWCLVQDSRRTERFIELRQLAIQFLRGVVREQIAFSSDSTEIVTDQLNLKESIVAYLAGNAKRDPRALQRAAWKFHTDCFAFDQNDMKLLVDCYVTSRDGARSTVPKYEHEVVATALQQVTLSTPDDVDLALQACVKDPHLPRLMFEPILRYAQLPNAMTPPRWNRQHKALTTEAPVIATFLAAEFISASPPRSRPKRRQPMPLPSVEIERRRRKQEYILEGDDIYAVPLKRGELGEEDYAEPADMVKHPKPKLPSSLDVNPPMRSIESYKGAIAQLKSRLVDYEKQVSSLTKAFRDEKRLRLLMEERVRSLGGKVHRQNKRAPGTKPAKTTAPALPPARRAPAKGPNKFANFAKSAQRAAGDPRGAPSKVRAHDSDESSSSDEEDLPPSKPAPVRQKSTKQLYKQHSRSIRARWGQKIGGLAHTAEASSSSDSEDDGSVQPQDVERLQQVYEELEKLDAESDEDPLYASVDEIQSGPSKPRRQLPTPAKLHSTSLPLKKYIISDILNQQESHQLVLKILVENFGPSLRLHDPSAKTEVSVVDVWISLLQLMYNAACALVSALKSLESSESSVFTRDVAHAFGDRRDFFHVYPRALATFPILQQVLSSMSKQDMETCVSDAKDIVARSPALKHLPQDTFTEWLSSPLDWPGQAMSQLEALKTGSLSDADRMALRGVQTMFQELECNLDSTPNPKMFSEMKALSKTHSKLLAGNLTISSRYYIGSFRQMVTRSAEGFIKAAQQGSEQPKEKLGATATMNLLSDGLLISWQRGRLGTGPKAEFLPLYAIKVIPVNDALSMFGLQYTTQSGEACKVFRSETVHTMHEFLKLFEREQKLQSVVATAIEV